MKILHINSYFANRFFYQDLIEEQISLGNNVLTVIPTEDGFMPSYQYDENVFLLPAYSHIERFLYPIRFTKILNAVKKEINISDYDIIHAHSLFTNGYIAYALSRASGVPYCVTIRNVDINGFFRYGIPFFLWGKRVLDYSKSVFFLSYSYKNIVEKKYYKRIKKEKCQVVPNGINDFWQVNRIQNEKKLSHDTVRFIYAGEINVNKNIIASAEAINMFILETGITSRFLVVGKIIDVTIANKLNEYDFVTIEEPVQKEKLLQMYRNSDIYIMPSFTESFGLTYVEAMTQGLPVIYSEGQGFDGQFKEGEVGYHVNPRNIYDIEEKIKLIVNNYYAISLSCVVNAEKYSWKKIAEKYQEVYLN